MSSKISKRHLRQHVKTDNQCVVRVVFAWTPNYTIVVCSQVAGDILVYKTGLQKFARSTLQTVGWSSPACGTPHVPSFFLIPPFSLLNILIPVSQLAVFSHPMNSCICFVCMCAHLCAHAYRRARRSSLLSRGSVKIVARLVREPRCHGWKMHCSRLPGRYIHSPLHLYGGPMDRLYTVTP